ncbi:hypothetical protein ACIOHG_31560, partial [Kitasatospora sp. NPDC088134]
MGESPQSERRDGETRRAGAEQDPREPGEGGSTVHLRVRDTDSPTTALRLPVDRDTTSLRTDDLDLPESADALTGPRPTPRDEKAAPGETATTPTEPEPSAERDAQGEEEAEKPAEAGGSSSLTMTLRLPEAAKDDDAEDESAENAKDDDAKAEDVESGDPEPV